jgi:hypothetical protein
LSGRLKPAAILDVVGDVAKNFAKITGVVASATGVVWSATGVFSQKRRNS